MSLIQQDKQDIRDIVKGVVVEDVTPQFKRLEAKMDHNHTINIKHHLETRKMVGDLKQSHDTLREGLRTAST